MLNTPLASAFSSIKGIPGTLIITDADLDDYDVKVYLKRGHISLDPLDVVVAPAAEEVEEVVEEVVEVAQEVEEIEEVEEVIEENSLAEDTTSEPVPSVYSKEELQALSMN